MNDRIKRMEWFNTEQIKQLRGRRFARTTLAAIGLAAVVILLSAVWYQGNATGLRSEAPHLTEIVLGGPAGLGYSLEATLHGTGFLPTSNTVVI
jgi:hypothetical protein